MQALPSHAFDQGHDGLLVTHTNDRITITVARLLALFNVSEALANGAPIGDLSEPILSRQAPPNCSLLAGQVLVWSSSRRGL